MSTFFTAKEIDGLKEPLLTRLYDARARANVPFIISSGYRTPEENAKVGGVGGSAHVAGLAVDLSCSDGSMRLKMLRALLAAGFNRIGIYNLHIHVDCDSSKPQDVIWTGTSH